MIIFIQFLKLKFIIIKKLAFCKFFYYLFSHIGLLNTIIIDNIDNIIANVKTLYFHNLFFLSETLYPNIILLMTNNIAIYLEFIVQLYGKEILNDIKPIIHEKNVIINVKTTSNSFFTIFSINTFNVIINDIIANINVISFNIYPIAVSKLYKQYKLEFIT